MLRLALVLAFIVCPTVVLAQAAPPSPAIAAYRDYTAALKNNDLAGAEAAAVRAWRASEESDGDGGRTAIFAYNVANTRIALKREADAVEPARRASALADKGAAGVDPIAARLLLGQALLAENFVEASTLLPDALKTAVAGSPQTRSFAYDAGVAFGRTAATKKAWDLSVDAWSRAFDFADAAPGDVEINRATALIGRGITFVAQRKDFEAIESFSQALVRVAPLAPESDDERITVAEYTYAQAYGWYSAAAARILSEMDRPRVTGSNIRQTGTPPPPLPEQARRQPLSGKAPLCAIGYVGDPGITYPAASLNAYGVGAAVIRLKVDSTGNVLARQVIASVPNPDFGKSIDGIKKKWKIKPSENSPAGCRLETNDFFVVVKYSLG